MVGLDEWMLDVKFDGSVVGAIGFVLKIHAASFGGLNTLILVLF